MNSPEAGQSHVLWGLHIISDLQLLIPSTFLFEHEAPAMTPDDQRPQLIIVTTNKKRLIDIYLVKDVLKASLIS